MKGRNPNTSEKLLWDLMAAIVGCIACRKDGRINHAVSIHHIDGRTRKDAHRNVLPLCAGHHQDGTGAPGLTAVHPWKRRFEDQYGTQQQLLDECLSIIREHQLRDMEARNRSEARRTPDVGGAGTSEAVPGSCSEITRDSRHEAA